MSNPPSKPPVPTPPRTPAAPIALRTSVVVDYQNIHLTGRDLFPCSRHRPTHECLIDPLNFANQLLRARNARQLPGYPAAALGDVWVFRGQPSAEHDPNDYARSQAQKSQWERDRRVHVHLRPLKYTVERDARGEPVRDVHGHKIVKDKKEKGVDVLCALSLVREAMRPDIDLVIIASHDSDLEPALDEALRLGVAKVETMRWSPPDRHVYELRPSTTTQVWNTRLDEQAFQSCWDRTRY